MEPSRPDDASGVIAQTAPSVEDSSLRAREGNPLSRLTGAAAGTPRRIMRWQSKQIMCRPLGDFVVRREPQTEHFFAFIRL